ncbi:protein translocase subunit SecDF [bacterium]|nr:protein translocase subunit SecDF [bacterium]
MKNKGFIQVITLLLLLASIYQLSFTFITNGVENDAERVATLKYPSEDQTNLRDSFEKEYLDSMRGVDVYNLGIGSFTYSECLERELNLGLDLQGGMNVTLEVATPDIIDALSNESDNKEYREAFEKAKEEYLGQRNFVDVFAENYKEVAPEGQLASIFYSRELEDYLPNKFNSTNEEIYEYLKIETESAIDRAFEIISTRIDKFGVAQPNIQRLENGRILVELPGVDDPSRVRKILQGAAELQFWFMYPLNDAYEHLSNVNKIVYSLEKPAGDSAAAENTGLSSSLDGGLTSTESEESTDSTEEGSLTGSLESTDSLDQPDSTKSQEQLQAENPVLSKFTPNIDQENNTWRPNGILGYVQETDKDDFDKWFNLPEVKDALPVDIHFKWSFKPIDEAGTIWALYALKSNKDGDPALEGDVITDARPSRQANGELSVSMTMNQEGAKTWRLITAQAASANPKEAIAIVLDNQVYSAPTVNGEIPNGMSVIEGNYTQNEAEDLANILKAGKLPAPARITGESTVGPTLGAKAIASGQTSLIIGFLLVIVFMIFYYGKAGIYADIALLVNLLLIVGVLAGYGAALTLPGMAGLVLTIGMAVDANVLVFERIREEFKNGKSFKMAVRDGYKGAYSSIIDANITTAIAGIILLVLGKGPVMGFAVILVIGIASSLFTSIFLTRLFIERDIDKGRETTFYTNFSKNIFQSFNWNFIGKRKIFYIVSGLIITAGIISLSTKGLSRGVDFDGGWSYTIQVDDASVGEIRNALNSGLGQEANNQVKTYGGDGQYRVTTTYMINSTDKEAAENVQAKVIESLSDFKVSTDDILSSDKVGPTIAEDIKNRSTIAIIVALIGIFLYIIGRFRKWGFGLGATVALFHDVLIVFSLYSILDGILPFSLDIDQAFIAAILTVVGYSINDTVVVFDRVREFLALNKHESDLGAVINDAINQTLSRTMITSLTTLLVIVILFVAGGEGLKDFTFALLIGVAVGTYSSVCIATPIVVDFLKSRKKK